MKKAFTLLELVFVIAIVGILSVVLAPNFQRDTLQEAANQVVSHIRYTQHLAMMDNQFDSNDRTWFKDRWQIHFVENVKDKSGGSMKKAWAYTIYSDDSNHDLNPNVNDTIAENTQKPNILMTGGYASTFKLDDARIDKMMTLAQMYGIQDMQFNMPNRGKRIIFDNLGRPYTSYKKDSVSTAPNPYSDMKLLRNRAIITLCDSDPCSNGNIIKLAIEPETGYTHIL